MSYIYLMKKNFILIIYGIVLLAMNIFMVYPSGTINYLRYIYTLFITLYVIIKYRSNFKLNMFIASVCGILLLHTVLFGFILSSGNLQTGIIDNAKEMIIFIFFIFFTSYYIKEEGKFKEFIIISCIIFTAFTNINYFIHFTGWAPIKFLPELLSGTGRVRFDFGYTSYNTAAYATLPSFILPLFIFNFYVNKGKLMSLKWIVYSSYLSLSAIISFLVILSTQTRIVLLVSLLLLVVLFVINNTRIIKIISSIDWKIYLIVIALLASLYAYYIFGNENSRSIYISQNMQIFHEYANKWIGMGYLDISAFLARLYGYNTGPMDNYYAYILCSTGYLGLVIILIPMIIMLIKLIISLRYKQISNEIRIITLLYIVMLFVGFSEATWIAPFNPESYIFWLLYFYAIYESDSIKRQRNSKVSFSGRLTNISSKELV